MDWNALQAVAEVVAAAGVVATLLYVARQIRDATFATQSSAVVRCAEMMQSARSQVLLNDDIAAIYVGALSGRPVDNALHAVRQRLLLCDLSRVHEAIYFQHATGHLPDTIWTSWQEELRMVWSTPGGRAALVAFDNKWLDPAFAEYLGTLQNETDALYMESFRQRWAKALVDEQDRLRPSATVPPANEVLLSAGE